MSLIINNTKIIVRVCIFIYIYIRLTFEILKKVFLVKSNFQISKTLHLTNKYIGPVFNYLIYLS